MPLISAPKHPSWRPAGPFASWNNFCPFDDTPRHGEDQCHRHIGRVLGEDAWRIGDGHPSRQGGGHVDIVDAIAEIGDEFHLRPGEFNELGIDPVGHGWNDHLGGVQGFGESAARHWLVVDVEPRIEQLAHAGFNDAGQFAGHDNERLFPAHSPCPLGSPDAI